MSKKELKQKSYIVAGVMAIAVSITSLSGAVQAIQENYKLVALFSCETGFIIYYNQV